MISTLSHAASPIENDLINIIAQKDFHIHELRIKSEKINPNQLMFGSIIMESMDTNKERTLPVEPVVPQVVSKPRSVKKTTPVASPSPNISRGWKSFLMFPKRKRSAPKRANPSR